MRTEGAVEGGSYVIRRGGIVRTYPLDEARQDRKLLKAIERNGWQELPRG